MSSDERPGWLIPAFVALQLVLLAALTMGWRVVQPAPPLTPPRPTPPAQLDPRWALLAEGWPPAFVTDCGVIPVQCGDVVNGNTWDAPSALGDAFYADAHCIGGVAHHRGPERVFGLQIDTALAHTVHATLEWPTGSSEVALFEAADACPGESPAPTLCKLAPSGSEASASHTGPSRWWIVVDGPYEDPFTLRVTCTAD